MRHISRQCMCYTAKSGVWLLQWSPIMKRAPQVMHMIGGGCYLALSPAHISRALGVHLLLLLQQHLLLHSVLLMMLLYMTCERL